MSYDKYLKEESDTLQAQLDEVAKQKQKSNEGTLAQISEAIDRSADTAAGVYQKRLDDADAAYRAQYTDNAIREAFTREQIKNSMAASGMTDSGQNLSMQTAVALQRQKQDSEVTQKKRDYVREMQDAIDQVRLQAENEKKSQKISLDQSYQDWYDKAFLDMKNTASQNASTRYAADQDRIARETEAKAKAEQEALKLQNEETKYVRETDRLRAAYAEKLVVDAGYTEKEALVAAMKLYPVVGTDGYTSKEQQVYEAAGGGEAGDLAVAKAAVTTAREFLSYLQFGETLQSEDSPISDRSNGDVSAVVQAVEQGVYGDMTFWYMSDTQRNATLCEALAMSMAYLKRDGASRNYNQIAKEAAQQLGIAYADVIAAFGNY